MESGGRAPTAAGVDIGGTFTDLVLVDGARPPRAIKVPTTPSDQSEGLASSLAVAGGVTVRAIAHGTTTATNAVLERDVARTVLVTTEGFRDVLVIGRQDRPSLYDLDVVRPEPLVPSDLVVPVRERMGPDGVAVVPLDDAEVERVAGAVADMAPEAVAICLLFSYAGAAHEQRLRAAIAARLDVPITVSSELLPEFREYERASTCALDAAVAPVMRRYLGRLSARVPDSSISVMTSGGGVADVDAVASAPVLTLLSGPAAGVVAAAAIATQAGFDDALAFDMGGTSTDVCLIRAGQPEIATAAAIAGLPFGTPSVAIHTVGAGGGSIAALDAGGALRVGPRSAGANPGPACYGGGGTEPTVTDAHAVLGHLLPDQELGSSGLRLSVGAAKDALRRLAGFADPVAAAEGVVTVVRSSMLRALRRVSIERGVDPASLALVAYGGAGPLHASALARDLGCAAAVIPPAPGVLSALGLLLAPPRREASRTIMATWHRDQPPPSLTPIWEDLAAEARRTVAGATVTLLADCRYAGQSHELRLDPGEAPALAAVFDAAHEDAYGYAMPDEPIEVVTLRAVAVGTPELEHLPESWDLDQAAVADTAPAVFQGRRVEVPVVRRCTLRAGDVLSGPALVTQPDSTAVLNPGDEARVVGGGSLVVRW